jgi:hypothetical protein
MSLPLPPRGGHGKLRVVSVPAGQVWYRIVHARYASALHFSSGPAGRWNDAQADFGVLYVADAPGIKFRRGRRTGQVRRDRDRLLLDFDFDFDFDSDFDSAMSTTRWSESP